MAIAAVPPGAASAAAVGLPNRRELKGGAAFLSGATGEPMASTTVSSSEYAMPAASAPTGEEASRHCFSISAWRN